MAHEVPFRDIDEFTVPCVLDYDVENVVSAIRRREPIDGFLLPVPRYLAANGGAGESRLPRWLSIAPGRYYDKLAGFRAPSQSFTNGSGER
jgi:CRISPR-associated endonuclease/helicase Cas3